MIVRREIKTVVGNFTVSFEEIITHCSWTCLLKSTRFL